MKRRMMAMWSGAAAALLWAAPLLAAEGAEGGHPAGPSSPLYGPSEGVISGAVTIVVFIILVVVLGKYAWKPIAKGLEDREKKIRKDIADAEAARAQAEKTLREYTQQLAVAEQQVREMLAKASSEGEKLTASIKMSAQQEAESIKARATKDIEAAKNQAVAEVYEQAANLSTAVAEKILRRNLNAEDQRELVARSLEQLQGIGQ